VKKRQSQFTNHIVRRKKVAVSDGALRRRRPLVPIEEASLKSGEKWQVTSDNLRAESGGGC